MDVSDESLYYIKPRNKNINTLIFYSKGTPVTPPLSHKNNSPTQFMASSPNAHGDDDGLVSNLKNYIKKRIFNFRFVCFQRVTMKVQMESQMTLRCLVIREYMWVDYIRTHLSYRKFYIYVEHTDLDRYILFPGGFALSCLAFKTQLFLTSKVSPHIIRNSNYI